MRAPVVIFGAVAAGMVMLANAAWALNLTPPHGRHVPPLRAAPVQPQTEEAGFEDGGSDFGDFDMDL